MSQEPVGSPGAEEEASTWEDFVDLLYAPGRVFARRRGGPFLWQLTALTVLLAALLLANMTVLAPVYQAEMTRTLAEAGQPAMDVEQMVRMGRLFGVVGYFVVFPLAVMVAALMLWGGARLAGSPEGFATAAVIATYSQVPIVFQQVVALLQGAFMELSGVRGVQDLTIGLPRLMPPDPDPVLLALAMRVELFTLWGAVLTWVGLVYGARVSRGAALVVAAVIWILAALPAVVGALAAP